MRHSLDWRVYGMGINGGKAQQSESKRESLNYAQRCVKSQSLRQADMLSSGLSDGWLRLSYRPDHRLRAVTGAMESFGLGSGFPVELL